MLEVGDYVKIVDDGQTYSSYTSFFKQPEFVQYSEEYERSMSKIGWKLNNGEFGVIVGIGKHCSFNKTLLIVRLDCGLTTLIETAGVELVSKCCESDIDDIDIEELI